ncbi:MAG: glycosyltransferase family 2 protein [Pseudomonadota bacterium]
MRISLVTSLYRSERYVEEFCRRARTAITPITADYEIVLVHDGSPDNALAVARGLAEQDPNVIVVDLARNFGQHKALLEGMAEASGDYIFLCESDLEEEPEWIADFYALMQEKDCDVVYGVQTATKRGPLYRLGSWIFYRTLNTFSGADFPRNVVTARLMSRRYLDAMLEYGEREVFLAGIWHMVGFVQLPHRVEKLDRSPTTYSPSKLVYLFVNAVTAFSVRPLMFISVAGVVLSALAMLFILYLVWLKLGLGIASEGWASVMAAILMVGGILLFFNGVMAIYIAKIFIEVKKRPRTTVREIYRGRSVLRESAARMGISDVLAAEVPAAEETPEGMPADAEVVPERARAR